MDPQSWCGLSRLLPSLWHGGSFLEQAGPVWVRFRGFIFSASPSQSLFFFHGKVICVDKIHSVLPSTSPAQRTRTLVCAHTLISRVSMSWNNSHGLVIQIVLRRSRSALTTGISLLPLGHFPRNNQVLP